MVLRLTKVDEYQFLTCFKHKLWGSNTDRFKKWGIGDLLLFIVDKHITAIAEVSENSFKSEKPVWDNGLYPYRLPLKFLNILLPGDRIPLLGEIRDALISAWGTNYGWGILNQQILPENSANIIISNIKLQSNAIQYYTENLEKLLDEAKQKRNIAIEELKNKKPGKRGPKPKNSTVIKNSLNIQVNKNCMSVGSADNDSRNVSTIEEESNHIKAQHLLVNAGKISGCSVWVASNDRNRKYKGNILGHNCIDNLPNFGLNKEATEKISFIDTIWIQQNSPLCAFEVETTTIYSGLLRMSDLIALVPALKIKLFIVAPRERQDKVMKELRRPTFKKIGLNEYCKFIAIEDLEILLEKIKGLYGYVKPDVIDTIAIEEEIDTI
jgi:hypothetical protein